MKNTRTKKTRPTLPWDKFLLVGTIVGAFLLRVIPQWNKVFLEDGTILFRGVDPWYHMRLIDYMVANFPLPLTWDVFAAFPDGSQVGFYPLMGWITVGISKLGINYEIAAALLPPILGALILVPIYFIGKEIFGKGVALLGCLLVAVMPGELLHRSLLGFTDHHILESFLMVTTIAFLLYTIRRDNLKYAAGAGITLGLYMLNWHGAAFFPAILMVWYTIEFSIRVRRREDSRRIGTAVVLTGGIALMTSVGYLIVGLDGKILIISLILLSILPVVLEGIRKISRSARWVYIYTASLAVSSLLIANFLLIPVILESEIANLWTIIGPVFWGFGALISEALPTDPALALNNYGVPFFFFFGGLFYLLKRRTNTLFAVWTIILMLAAIGQRRWGYYFTIPVSLLASSFIFEVSKFIDSRVRTATIIVICFFMLLPSSQAIIGVSSLPNNIGPSWYNALTWMRDNTFPSRPPLDYYGGGQLGIIGETQYGVLSWWDYGHWIIRVAERVPLSSPTNQGVPEVAYFLVAQSVEEANQAIRGLNIKYIILDESIVTTKFAAIVEKAELPMEDANRLRLGSMALMLWNNEAEGYHMIYDEDGVRIFEKIY